jgi:outer membrane biosynthesis protein TonB
MDNINDLLERGVAAAEAGRKEEAKHYLSQVIELNPEIEEAWLWLGGIAASPDESLIYFETALALNPRSERAKAGIDWAKARGARPKPTVVSPEEEPAPTEDFSRNWVPRNAYVPPQTVTQSYRRDRRGVGGTVSAASGGWLGWLTSGDGKRMALAGAIPLVILLVIVSVIVVRAGGGGGGSGTPTPLVGAVASVTPQSGLVLGSPTRTPRPTRTARPTEETTVEPTVEEAPTEEATPEETPTEEATATPEEATATPEESTPPPTVTPEPTQVPATNTPETAPPTNTPVPPAQLAASLSVGQGTVAPGGFQTLSVTTNPGASVMVLVTYSSGVTQSASGQADDSGVFSVRLQTPGDAPAGGATVSVSVTQGDKSANASGGFQIGQ